MTNRYPDQFLQAQTENGAAFEAGATLRPVEVDLEKARTVEQFAVVPKDWRLQRVEVDDLITPRWAEAKLFFDDEHSFATYCARFWQDGASIAFAQRDGRIDAIFDYHSRELPGRSEHRAVFVPRRTESYTRWKGANRSWLSQENFLELLEDRMRDIAKPDGAELVEVVQFFRAHQEVGFQSGRNLTNGTVQLVWTESAEGSGGSTGNLPVPLEFVIALKPYRDVPDIKAFTARLRWRVSKAKVDFMFQFNDEELDEFLDEVNEARNVRLGGTLSPIIFGTRA